jgi:hypothetical protein
VGNVSTVPVSLHIPLVLAACSRGLPANRQLHSTIPRETQTDTLETLVLTVGDRPLPAVEETLKIFCVLVSESHGTTLNFAMVGNTIGE